MGRYSEAVEPGTVWTWNAIGKSPGAWGLAPEANEVAQGLPAQPPDHRHAAAAATSNSDPVTGQAGWYDVRVRISGGDEEAFRRVPACAGPNGAKAR